MIRGCAVVSCLMVSSLAVSCLSLGLGLSLSAMHPDTRVGYHYQLPVTSIGTRGIGIGIIYFMTPRLCIGELIGIGISLGVGQF